MKEKAKKLPSVEESLAEITNLIEKMEKSELTLEQSLSDFERGITLVKHCQKMLTEAEQKVQLLIERNGQHNLTDYSNEDGKEDEST